MNLERKPVSPEPADGAAPHPQAPLQTPPPAAADPGATAAPSHHAPPRRKPPRRRRRHWLIEVWHRIRDLLIDMLADFLSMVILVLPFYFTLILEQLPGSAVLRGLLANLHELAQAVFFVIFLVYGVLNFIRNRGRWLK